MALLSPIVIPAEAGIQGVEGAGQVRTGIPRSAILAFAWPTVYSP
jgi:hypothetical protein